MPGSIFDIAAKSLVRAFGEPLIYQQGGWKKRFNIDIDKELEIIDPESGASSYVSAAIIANSEFPFTNVIPHKDTIIEGKRVWRVQRILEDDGSFKTLEVI